MPELNNAGLEAFAQGHARGLSQKEAWIAAGYSAKAAGDPWRVYNREGVKARIAELATQRPSLAQANLEETLLLLHEFEANGSDRCVTSSDPDAESQVVALLFPLIQENGRLAADFLPREFSRSGPVLFTGLSASSSIF